MYIYIYIYTLPECLANLASYNIDSWGLRDAAQGAAPRLRRFVSYVCSCCSFSFCSCFILYVLNVLLVSLYLIVIYC